MLHKNTLAYRADIDGLRAVAVLAVVAYHLSPQTLKGGFLGVDVFFVISGFLITKIILTQLRHSTFSFVAFYEKRIKRLFPVLLVVLAASCLYGYFVLFPQDFGSLLKHSAFASLFLSNAVLYQEVGYFDVASHQKPLLHLWSLAVEEQFYLGWPLFLWGFYRLIPSIRWLRFGIAFVTLGSFVFYLYGYGRNPSRCFYFTFARLWELSAGALVACWELTDSSAQTPPRKEGRTLKWLPVVCFLCLVGCLVFGEKSREGFQYFSVLPITATGLLIALQKNAFVGKLLSHPFLVAIGLISYPLYLIHWPVISFIHIINPSVFHLQNKILVLLFSILGAFLLYRYVEKPLRQSISKKVPVCLLGTMALLGAFSWWAWTSNLPCALTRQIPEAPKVTAVFREWNYPHVPGMEPMVYKGQTFHVLGSGEDVVLFWGDSNMQQYSDRLAFLFQTNDLKQKAVFATGGGQCPIPNVGRTNEELSFTEAAYEFARSQRVKKIVLCAQWSGYLGGSCDYFYHRFQRKLGTLAEKFFMDQAILELEKMVRALIALGKEVVIVLNMPVGNDYGPQNFFKRTFYGQWQFSVPLPSQKAWYDFINPAHTILLSIAQKTGAATIDPGAFLCDGKICRNVDQEGVPIYKNGCHLRPGYVAHHIHFLDGLVQ